VHPIEYFLFKSRAGDCEYFAGALCLMLRSIGIPARVVEGFKGAEPTSVPNEFIVRFSAAHAWVEAALDDTGWTRLDPTPPGSELAENYFWRLASDLYDSLDYEWTKNVIYFDRSDQAMIFEAFTKLLSGRLSLPFATARVLKSYPLPVIMAVSILSIAALVIFLFRRKEVGFSEVYLMTMRDLVKQGILRGVHPWHEQNVTEIIEKFPSLKDPVLRFMDDYLRARFGKKEDISPKMLKQARNKLLESARGVDRPSRSHSSGS
ncbi:MAG: transglutaminase-like domain-containing protein, partial [Desulfomonilaceae bacterium]